VEHVDPAELREHLEAFIARETGSTVRVENLFNVRVTVKTGGP